MRDRDREIAASGFEFDLEAVGGLVFEESGLQKGFVIGGLDGGGFRSGAGGGFRFGGRSGSGGLGKGREGCDEKNSGAADEVMAEAHCGVGLRSIGQ